MKDISREVIKQINDTIVALKALSIPLLQQRSSLNGLAGLSIKRHKPSVT